MRAVSLTPTHVIATSAQFESAWNGIPVSAIHRNLGFEGVNGGPYHVCVMLVSAEEAAAQFQLRNRYLAKDEQYSITPEDVLRVYGNGGELNNYHEPWLPDDALIQEFPIDYLLALYKDSDVTIGDGDNTQLVDEFLVNNFCSCQHLIYGGERYLYGIESCGVHGEYDASMIQSAIANRKMSIRMAGSFQHNDRIEPLTELVGAIVLGHGEYPTNERGVYIALPSEYGYGYSFIPRSRFDRDMWERVEGESRKIELEG
jgi:hypothetical protein